MCGLKRGRGVGKEGVEAGAYRGKGRGGKGGKKKGKKKKKKKGGGIILCLNLNHLVAMCGGSLVWRVRV